MRLALKLHPDSLCPAATRIDVDVVRPDASRIVVGYAVTGRIADLHLPPVTSPTRAEELWQHTCFEVFAGCAGRESYYEFNFAPSTQWAAYQFDGYRRGMRAASAISAPVIEVQASPERFILQGSLELDQLSSLPRDTRWRLGLSALIEEGNGRVSYWALAHPPGKPDFHHPDCFAYEFSPT
jgi:hypothetical protein